jgi:DNA replication protein DnaC
MSAWSTCAARRHGLAATENLTLIIRAKGFNLPQEQLGKPGHIFQQHFDFATRRSWLVLLDSDRKTHLAAAIANHQIKMGRQVKLVVVPDLLDHLRSAFNPDSKTSYDQLFEEVKNIPLLILDDFGEQSTTPWAEEKLYQIINHRYNGG